MSLDDATLEQRLRDTYDAVDAAIDVPAPSDALHLDGETDGVRRVPESPRRRARAVTATFAAVLVVAVAVAVAVVARSHSSSERGRRPGSSPAVRQVFPTYPDHQGPELLLAPGSVPAGFHLVVSTPGGGSTGAAGSAGGTVQDWVKLDLAGQRPLALFQVTWGPADFGEAARQSGIPDSGEELHGDRLNAFRSQSVAATVAGRDALYSESLATFAWEQDNQLVTVSGGVDGPFGAWPEHLTRDELETIAAHLVRDPDGRYTLTEIPDGFRLSAEVPSYASEGTNARELAYSDGANHGFAIQLVDDTQQPPGVALISPTAHLTIVRGQRAVVTPHLNEELGCGVVDYVLCADVSHLSVIWTEPDNTTVTVISVGISETQLLAIAHSLEPVQPGDWPHVAGR